MSQEIEIVPHSSKSSASKNLGDGNSNASIRSPSTPSEHISSPRMYHLSPTSSIAIMNYLVPSPSTRVVNNSQVNGAQSSSSRNCTLSTSNASAVASPFSPLNTNSNHHDQNSRSMSPRLSIDQPSIPNPTTSTNIDPLASVSGFPFE